MATNETVQIDLLINTAKSAKNLTDTKKALQDLKNQLSAIGKDSADFKKLSEAITDTTLKAAGAANTFRDMRGTLKDVKDAMELLGPEDKNFTKLNAAAGKLEHQMKLVSDSIKYTSGTPLKNLSAGFTGIRDSLLTGDFEEMGVASKALGNSLLQLAKGALENIKNRFLSFGKGTTGIFKSLGKVFSGDFKGGLKTAQGALKDFGDALKVNPIFLIASVVALIIANFDKLKTSGGLVGKVFSAIGDTIKLVIDKLKALSDFFGFTSFAAQDAAQKQLDYYDKIGKAEDESYSRKEKLAKAEAELLKAKTKGNKENLALVKKQAKEEYDLEIDHLALQKVVANEQAKLIRQTIALTHTETDEQKKQLEELQKSMDDIDNDVKISQDKYKTAVINADNEITKQNEENAKKRAEARKKEEEEREKDLNEFGELNKKISQEGLSENDKARKEVENGYTEDKDKLDKLLDDKSISLEQYNATVLKLNQQSASAIKLINDKEIAEQKEKDDKAKEDKIKNQNELAALEIKLYGDKTTAADKARESLAESNQKELDDLKKLLDNKTIDEQQYETLKIQLAKQTSDELVQINKEEQKKKTEDFKKHIDQVLALQKDMFDGISGLSDAFAGKSKDSAKKNFQIQKDLSLANAVVSGIESVVKSVDAGGGIPTGIPFGVAAATMAAANIAKISKSTFEGGAGGSSPSISSAGSAPQSFGAQPLINGSGQAVFQNAVGAPSQTSSNAGGSNPSNSPTVIQAYVTSEDINNATNKSAVLTRRSKF